MTNSPLHISKILKGEVKLPLSKSECNRLLMIRAITGTDYFRIERAREWEYI